MRKLFLFPFVFLSACIINPHIFIYNSLPIKIIPTLTVDLVMKILENVRTGMSAIR